MDSNVAVKLSKVIENYSNSSDSLVIEKKEPKKSLAKFHHWANGKTFEAGFLISNSQGQNIWLLLMKWHTNNGFYLVLYPEDRSGPVAEIHAISDDFNSLTWKYMPSKSDGRNIERKEYFEKFNHDLNISFHIPSNNYETSIFLESLTGLFNLRLKSDELDEDTPAYRDGFPEGLLKEKLHKYKERNTELIREVKREALDKYKKLECECCNFNFSDTYGDLGAEYIEAHHLKPISSLKDEGDLTNKADIALVCSNCHRMLHRKRPWLGIGELKELLNS
ncbi:HNH endonuclease [Marinicellulosiphila megalodicopiae]|uniref:HNH endonuclease n=1 Tax=Marinicellulosiphila megalodicopiae TaxID=2724896 RepID=UPI003BB08A01